MDVIAVAVADALPGDLVVDAAGDAIGTVTANVAGIFMVDFGMFDWHWQRSRIDGARCTAPVPEALRTTYARHSGGRRLRGAILEVCRQV